MKKIALCIGAGLMVMGHAAFSQTGPKEIKRVSWLIGTWKMSLGAKGSTYEVWKFDNDSTLRASSFMVRANGDTVPSEKLQLKYRDRKMVYESTVSGQNNNLPVPFVIKELTQNGFTAENTAHDFPQRIIYSLESPTILNASIEGMFKGKFRKEEFPLERVK